MGRLKCAFKPIIVLMLIGFFFILDMGTPVEAQLSLTEEEINYIANRGVIRAASIDGGAPLHYTNSKGEITGIAVRILDEISNKTGLVFEYQLYEYVDEALQSDSHILFGITPNYAPKDMTLSQPYLVSEAILYINSSLDPNKLEGKAFAAIEGGNLPEGVLEENVVYYANREKSLDAVEGGKSDYGYGNAYSVAFYTLQNGYQNIITIPKGKEAREYSIGFLEEDDILLSIINKSINSIDEGHMQTLILDATSRIDRKITLSMIIKVYGKQILGIMVFILFILLYGAIYNIRMNKQLLMRNKKNEILSQISNEYLYEYYADSDTLVFSEKSLRLFGEKQNINKVSNILKEQLLSGNLDENISTIELPKADESIGVFRIIYSNIFDDKGKLDSIIGKLIDISEEIAEKEILITRAQLDGLTGLYNAMTSKKLISDRIRERAMDELDVFMIIDCDKFKNINDTYGHLVGDRVLANISNALKFTFRKTDIIGRVGGDEFCIYMKNVPSMEFIYSKSKQLSRAIREFNEGVGISVSIGIALNSDVGTYEELFIKADAALYAAKDKGGAQTVIHGYK